MFGRTKQQTKTVYVGLSGGVDSAVSAALLQREGYTVVGVFIRIAIPGYPCRAGEDKREAMRVAAHLGIPFKEVDLSKEYEEAVFRVSLAEFERGRTPNPDALCNREIKFGIFFDWCKAAGADLVATGHYAQTKSGELYMGADPDKDQSYFLWAVPEEKLRHTLFPVGGLRKKSVRALAEKFGLPNAERKDSQGLCFLSGITVEDMLSRELAPVPGNILSDTGEIIGTHRGAAYYTLGQRHGFSIAGSSPQLPHFVTAKSSEANTITVATERTPKGSGTQVSLVQQNWIGEATSGACMARFRYRQTLMPATLDAVTGSVLLHEPHHVPVGQSLVLYRNGRCLGGGVADDATVVA